jgi:hypothetical protein
MGLFACLASPADEETAKAASAAAHHARCAADAALRARADLEAEQRRTTELSHTLEAKEKQIEALQQQLRTGEPLLLKASATGGRRSTASTDAETPSSAAADGSGGDGGGFKQQGPGRSAAAASVAPAALGSPRNRSPSPTRGTPRPATPSRIPTGHASDAIKAALEKVRRDGLCAFVRREGALQLKRAGAAKPHQSPHAPPQPRTNRPPLPLRRRTPHSTPRCCRCRPSWSAP